MTQAREPTLAKPPGQDSARQLIRERAHELGLAGVGFASVEPLERARAALECWLAQGFAGRLGYLEATTARSNPRALLPEARTVVVAALALPAPPDPAHIARFARYPSYHDLLVPRLRELGRTVADAVGRPVAMLPCVDREPLLERPLAERAGLGFVADSAMLSVKGHGTHVVLGELLLDVDLAVDEATGERCRGCGACRKACPTGALLAPGVVEARRCVSYLTQTPGVMPRDLRSSTGTWVFGCDACQAVCPENRSVLLDPDPLLGPALPVPSLIDLVAADRSTYQRMVNNSRLSRARPNLLARNAAIALGNLGGPESEQALSRAVSEHPSPLVRAHAVWALGGFSEDRVRAVMSRAANEDPDDLVREEARARLGA